MKIVNKKFIVFCLLTASLFLACEDLSETNVDPNGMQPQYVHPNLILPTVISETGIRFVNLGYQDIAGVMQHTQKNGWASAHNGYDWGGSQDWNSYYDVLRNNQLLYDRAVEMKMEFHQGVSLVVRAMMFGLITDLWGDAPYTNALKGAKGGAENLQPVFDSQETIYTGILGDLEAANTLLSKARSEYTGITGNTDLLYGGDPAKWRKLANSLALRYYMRISSKKSGDSKAGVEKIVGNPATYPIITSASDDAAMEFPGTSLDTSWPTAAEFGNDPTNYTRLQIAEPFVTTLQTLKDPRLGVWVKKVAIPLVVDASLPAGTDKVENGKRYLSPDKVGSAVIDTDPDYVGLPVATSALPAAYNLNPTPNQGEFNPHVSGLSDVYKKSKDPLLKARLVSAAEVNFILAEAALKGWAVGSAETYYKKGVEESLKAWGVGASYATYITEAGVAYNGTLEQIIQQKWIASWTAAAESWFDYRRTGLPDLQAGPVAKRQKLPVRFYYGRDELQLNEANTRAAMSKLEVTAYSQADGENSAWSKPWLLQGTNKPW
jgi:hypothetical protein